MHSKRPASDAIQLSMLENGLDFIRSGLKFIAKPESKFDLKYAVLHLSAGIELVLKDRLRREDWRLIFKDVTKANEKKMQSGNFISVSLWECLERINEHCSVDAPDKKPLERFKNLRNPIEHFAMNHSQAALESSAASVLGDLIDFIGEAFEEDDLSEDESYLLKEIRTQLGEFRQFTASRMAAIKSRLKDHKKHYGQIVECPSCLQDALMADCDVSCAFCGYAATAEEAAELYISNNFERSYFDPKEDEPELLHICPNCDNRALVYEPGYSETSGICFSCGDAPEPGDLVECDQCGELSDPESMHGGQCMDCIRAYIAQDNS